MCSPSPFHIYTPLIFLTIPPFPSFPSSVPPISYSLSHNYTFLSLYLPHTLLLINISLATIHSHFTSLFPFVHTLSSFIHFSYHCHFIYGRCISYSSYSSFILFFTLYSSPILSSSLFSFRLFVVITLSFLLSWQSGHFIILHNITFFINNPW